MRRRHVILLLLGAFVLRLAYGLSSELFGPDESQVFLIGLQFFTTRAWPYYGPDVVYTHTQLPGALQGLLVGGPMFLVAQPEAPYVVLNVLSLGALSLLAWYIGRRLPDVPRWFLWPWVLFCPWALNYSAHIINTSYVLPGAAVFFVGAAELTPRLRIGAISKSVAFFCVGVSLLWMAQIQMQFMLLLPVTALVFALVLVDRPRDLLTGLPWFAAGAALTGATLVPTLLHDGLGAVTGLVRSNMTVEPRTVFALPALVARFLSFAGFELARFLGSSTEQRVGFLEAYPWAAPFAVIAGVMGVLQTAALLTGFFWKHPIERDWAAVRNATVFLLALVCVAFTLSVKGPASHAFYAMMPAVMIYSFYCWAPVLRRPAGRRAAALLLVSGAVTLTALGIRNAGLRSLYTNRPLVMRAIVERNYHLIGERRPDVWKSEPGR